MNMLFLNLYIRRAHLVSDSLVEVSHTDRHSNGLSKACVGDKKPGRSEEETTRDIRRRTRSRHGRLDKRMVPTLASANFPGRLR